MVVTTPLCVGLGRIDTPLWWFIALESPGSPAIGADSGAVML